MISAHEQKHLRATAAAASAQPKRHSLQVDSLGLRPPVERHRKRSVIDKILYTDTDIDEIADITGVMGSDVAGVGTSTGLDDGTNIELIAKGEHLPHHEHGIALNVRGEEKREQWNSFMEYFLSIIGFVIDLGNVWRF